MAKKTTKTETTEETPKATPTVATPMTKAEDGTITFHVVIPAAVVAQTWEEQVEKAIKTATVPGFREGKAPREMVEPRLDQDKLREEVLKKLLPTYYVEAVNKAAIRPIINPKIHVTKLDQGQDWEFDAMTCEMPEVKLNNYKEEVKKITAKGKIVIPGKEEQQPDFDAIVKALLDTVTVNIPEILIEGEVDRLLSQLLQEIQSLGLSLDQYLASSKKTPDDLRKEFAEKAKKDIAFEFSLQKIAEEEKITVEPKEVEEAIAKAKDDNERKQLEANVYLLANILRQQKTLDFLKNL